MYFKLAQEKAEKADDEQSKSIYKSSTRNLAYLEQQLGENEAAISDLNKYLAVEPGDAQAKRDLAAALRLTGKTAEAAAIDKQMMSSGAMTTHEIMTAGVAHMEAKDYATAAEEFIKVLSTEPGNRDAMFDLANAYLGLKDGKKLVETSQRLLDIEPLSVANLQLLFNGFRMVSDTNKQIETYNRIQGIPVAVVILSFSVNKDGAKLGGTVTGREARTAGDKVIVPTPLVLVFDFMNAQGGVVASQEVAVPALKPDVKQDIAVEATGAGIVSWRYHAKQP